MWSVVYLITGVIFIALLISIFFSKEKIDTKEIRCFKVLIIANFLEYIFEGILHLLFRIGDIDNIVTGIISKSYLILILFWGMFFTLYVMVLCFRNKNLSKINKFFKLLISISFIMGLILIVALPAIRFHELDVVYIYGPAIDALKIFSFTYIFLWIVLLIVNHRNLLNKEYIPIYINVVLLIAGGIVQTIEPSILISSITTTIVCYTIFFTIENPDVKIIEELRKNKKIIEQGNEDKSSFLFRMSQEIKKPIDDIIRVNNIIDETNDIETIKKCSKYIDYNSNELKNIVNNVLDVSKMDVHNIKLIDSTYNVHNIFNEIFSKYDKIISKNINYRYNISKNIPDFLYGDPVKIKQVVNTILENSYKHTKQGFIEANVDSIEKNNVCRLIISIEDSGSGMSIDKVNQLLTISESISEEDLPKLDSIKLDINIVSKIVRLLGGQLIIKSEEHVGSEFIIILEQKIKNDEENKKNDFSKFISHKKNTLIVSDKQQELNTISNIFEKYDIEVVKSMYASECLDRINNKQKFDLIIVDDDMKPTTGINLLQQLQTIEKFKTPVVILLDKNKESIKEHYIKDGFADYVLKENLNEELDKIKKKFI